MSTNECKINPENNIKKLFLTKNKCKEQLNNPTINSRKKIEQVISEINDKISDQCPLYNKTAKYNIKYINEDKFYKFDIEIIDFITDNKFIDFLDLLKLYLQDKNAKLSNLKVNKLCDLKCAKNKMLLLFVIDNFITDDIYSILVKNLGQKIYESFNDIYSTHKNINNGSIDKYKLFSIKDDIIIIDFLGIRKYLFFEVIPIYQKNKNINNSNSIKVHFLINILIIGINYLFDNRNKITKISKNTVNTIKSNIFYVPMLPNCHKIDIIKNKLKELINNNKIKNISNIESFKFEILGKLLSLKTIFTIITSYKLDC